MLSIHVYSLNTCIKKVELKNHNDSFMMTHKINKNLSVFQFPGLSLSAVGLGSRSVEFCPMNFTDLERVESTLLKPILIHS